MVVTRIGNLIYIDNRKIGEQTIWFDPNPDLEALMEKYENCRFDGEMMCWIANFSHNELEKFLELLQNELVILASQLLMAAK